jgi:uncharacterized membrane-anchored protein
MDWKPYFCGICFGVFPLFANRSNLASGATFLIVATVSLLLGLSLFLPSGIASLREASLTQIAFGVASGLANAIGLLVMFRYLADTPTERAGSLVIIMVVTQIVATWFFTQVFSQTIPTGREIIGVALAAGAVFFLSK